MRLMDTAGAAKEMDQEEASNGPSPQVDGEPESNASHQLETPCSSSAVESLSLDASPEMVPTTSGKPPASSSSSSSEPPGKLTPDLPQQQQHQRPSVVSLGETDCLICFNRYSASRLPKVLACRHAFCAVCLKLILQHEDQTWIISCPLCRKATVVFGGLICSLQNKDDFLGRLESPGLDSEVSCLPGSSHHAALPPDSGNQDQADRETGQAAARRLVLLLLLVMLLIALVLPFIYTGLLKWALCFVVLLGLAMSLVLCCDPRWRCPQLPLPPWRKKESQAVSAA